MTDAILKLANWLSPAFPVGAFTYSHGLEWAVTSGQIEDKNSALNWIETCLRHGAGRNDAILLSGVMSGQDVEELDALALALSSSRERHIETSAQGTAFLQTLAALGGTDAKPRAYPIAVGLAALSQDCPERETIALYLQAFVSNLVSACIRLVPLGQTDGQRIIAALQHTIEDVTDMAMNASLDDIGGCAFVADIASMRHETQTVRLFRS